MKNNEHRVVITGASDGLGKWMAISFARRGARLGLIARRAEALQSVKDECLRAGAAQVEIHPVDVTRSNEHRQALQALDTAIGGTNLFIANAGVTGRSNIRTDAFAGAKYCLDVNLIAAVDGLEWMKERMVQRRSGTLVGMSSVAATRGLPDSGAYSASKAALSTYLESMRVDLRPTGVRVLTVAPGYIRTELTSKNKGSMPFLMDPDRAAEIFVKKIISGQRFIVAPWQYWWAIQILRIIPDWLYDSILGKVMPTVRGSKPKN